MEFLTWYVRRGRITRRVFWLHYALPLFALSALAIVVDLSFGATNLVAVADGTETTVEYGPFVTAVGLLTIVPTLSSYAARVHDQGRSAWWLLLNVVPFFGQVALLAVCGCVPGQPVTNRYGPPSHDSVPGPAVPLDGPVEPWTPGPLDRAPDYPPADWR